jgi:hypothetical protein
VADKKAGRRGNATLPYLCAPGSFKRLLGSPASSAWAYSDAEKAAQRPSLNIASRQLESPGSIGCRQVTPQLRIVLKGHQLDELAKPAVEVWKEGCRHEQPAATLRIPRDGLITPVLIEVSWER